MSARLLGVVVAFIYIYLTAQDSGQIAAIFNSTTLYWKGFLAICISWAAALLLCASQKDLPRSRRWDDYGIFLLSPILLTFRIAGTESAGPLLWAIAVLSAVILLILETRRTNPIHYCYLVLALALLYAGLHVSLRIYPIQLSRALGSLNITVAFTSILVLATVALIRVSIFGRLVLVSAVACFMIYEPSHEISTQKAPEVFSQPPPLQMAFLRWLLSRNDLGSYLRTGKPYPVVMVASEGGGGYAAAHSYVFLNKLQASCPNFAQHTFALVGVSGGAVGNALFAANLRDTNLSETMGCTDRPATFDYAAMSADNLSPVLAALLFHDAPNKALFGLLGGDDRTSVLAQSLVAPKGVEKLSTETMLGHFWGANDEGQLQIKDGPAVVPVASNVTSGLRYVFAPFAVGNEYPSNFKFEEGIRDLLVNDGERQDIRLIDATVASASFPYVTPSLTLGIANDRSIDDYNGKGTKLGVDGKVAKASEIQKYVKLVDGGYIDNSGVETVTEFFGDLLNINLDDEGMAQVDAKLSKSFGHRLPLHSCDYLEVEYSPPLNSKLEEATREQAEKVSSVISDFKDKLSEAQSESEALRKKIADLTGVDEGKQKVEGGNETSTNADQVDCTLRYSIYLIAIRSEDSPIRLATAQSFAFDPVNAVNQARQRRAETARYGFLSAMCGEPTCRFPIDGVRDWRYFESVIDPDFLALPLGWDIPRIGVDGIDKAVGSPLPPDKVDTLNEPRYVAQRYRNSSPFGHAEENYLSVEGLFQLLYIQEKPAENYLARHESATRWPGNCLFDGPPC